MENKTMKQLLKKAKKHKKWNETVFVNPIYWDVNGISYYMGGFTKNNKSIASIYLTIGEEKIEEALIAQPNLSLFADLSTNIFDVSTERVNIDSDYYLKPLAIAVTSQDPLVQQGRKAFSRLWEIQQKFNSLIKGYKNYYDNDVLVRGQIFTEDIVKTQETAIKVNMYQYLILNTLLTENEEIRTFAAYLETTEGWRSLTKDQRTFIKGITENREKMQNNLDGLQLIVDEDLEKMEELNYASMIEKNNKIIEGQKQYIRYPKQ